MASDIQAGDVVVCVAGDCGDPDHLRQEPSGLVVGRYYTVQSIVPRRPHWRCPCGVHVVELRNNHPWGSCGARFRKIRPADERFSQAIKACKPVSSPLPATVGEQIGEVG